MISKIVLLFNILIYLCLICQILVFEILDQLLMQSRQKAEATRAQVLGAFLQGRQESLVCQ